MSLIIKNEPLQRTDIAFQSPTQVKFGVGKVESLGGELQIEDDIAQRTRAIALQSVFAGLGLSLAAMLVAAAGYLPPLQGALLQEVIDARSSSTRCERCASQRWARRHS